MCHHLWDPVPYLYTFPLDCIFWKSNSYYTCLGDLGFVHHTVPMIYPNHFTYYFIKYYLCSLNYSISYFHSINITQNNTVALFGCYLFSFPQQVLFICHISILISLENSALSLSSVLLNPSDLYIFFTI